MCICGAMKLVQAPQVKLSHLYLEDGPAPPIDFLHMRVSPWL